MKVFATKLSDGLIDKLDSVCAELGLKKSYVVEKALEEKLEDLIDANDLRRAIKEATGFHSLESVRRELKK